MLNTSADGVINPAIPPAVQNMQNGSPESPTSAASPPVGRDKQTDRRKVVLCTDPREGGSVIYSEATVQRVPDQH